MKGNYPGKVSGENESRVHIISNSQAPSFSQKINFSLSIQVVLNKPLLCVMKINSDVFLIFSLPLSAKQQFSNFLGPIVERCVFGSHSFETERVLCCVVVFALNPHVFQMCCLHAQSMLRTKKKNIV